MKQGMSVFLIATLAIGMTFSIVSCGNSTNKETENEQTDSSLDAMLSEAVDSTSTDIDVISFFDPFEGVNIECSGVNGDITVTINSDDAYLDADAYFIEGETEGLSEGDEIIVKVSDSVLSEAEKSEGLIALQSEKTFYVTANNESNIDTVIEINGN